MGTIWVKGLVPEANSATTGMQGATVNHDGTNGSDSGYLWTADLGNVGGVGTGEQNVKVGLARIQWSLEMLRNLKWNNTTKKWDLDNTSYTASMIEVGREGVTLHAVPAGATAFSDQMHEMFQCRPNGLDSVDSGFPTTGKYNQFKAPLVGVYDSTAYSGNDAASWESGSTSGMIWLQSNEGVTSTTPAGGWIQIQQNSATATGGQIHFLKSRGSYNSQTTSNSGDNAGVISFGLFDGANYQLTARIIPASTAGATAGVAPQEIRFQTSATDTASLTTALTIGSDQKVTAAAGFTATGISTLTGGIVGGVQALSGAGAVNITTTSTAYTSTGGAQALTLADGTNGQIKTICHVSDGGSGVLTPTTKSGYTSVTFTNIGDTATLQFFTTAGWLILAVNGATITP